MKKKMLFVMVFVGILLSGCNMLEFTDITLVNDTDKDIVVKYETAAKQDGKQLAWIIKTIPAKESIVIRIDSGWFPGTQSLAPDAYFNEFYYRTDSMIMKVRLSDDEFPVNMYIGSFDLHLVEIGEVFDLENPATLESGKKKLDSDKLKDVVGVGIEKIVTLTDENKYLFGGGATIPRDDYYLLVDDQLYMTDLSEKTVIKQ